MPFVKGYIPSKEHREKLRLAHKGKFMGEQSSQWKGGKYRHGKGYVYVLKREHPYCDGKGYVFEHRLVMEQHLGRYIIPNIEDVHHINGIKDDNRIENLQLLPHGKHTTLTNTKDFSNTRCSVCKSNKTYTKNNGRPMWYHGKKDRNKFVCKKCYDRARVRSI